MIKTILKEFIITILLSIAILLILSILFYDYNPINKIVPNKIEQYATAENIKEEINEKVVELESSSVVYKVEGSDLNMYIKNKTYVQGKANPFEDTSKKVNEVANGNNTEGAKNEEQKTNTTQSDGTFWNSTNNK